MKPPLVSVVIPTYNGSRYIREALSSLQRQTMGDWEAIIVDDGSTDGTMTIVRDFMVKEPRVRLIEHPNNRKLPTALNSGFDVARGEFLTWISDDNLYRPRALEVMSEYLAGHPDVGLVYASATVINERGEDMYFRPASDPHGLHERNPVGWCFMYPASVRRVVGDYDPAVFLAEDVDYWMRISMRYRVVAIPEDLYLYRMHSESLTGTRQANIRSAFAQVQFKHILDLPWASRLEKSQVLYELMSIFIKEKKPWFTFLVCVRGMVQSPRYFWDRFKSKIKCKNKWAGECMRMKGSGHGQLVEARADDDLRIYMVGMRPNTFSEHSGLSPLARVIDVKWIEYRNFWLEVQKLSWRAGEWMRQWGIRHYGSTWNSLAPFESERRILMELPKSAAPYIVHFSWGEFGAPKRLEPYQFKGARVVVSVHCSARRWDSVWLRSDGYAKADQVVLTSESQRPFVERDVTSEKICMIMHGVASHYFKPTVRQAGGRFRLFMLGDTERDHEFAAQVAARLPASRFEWRIRTTSHERSFYQGIESVNLLPRLADEEMLVEYQQADVLAMPMLDSAANNVLLESMACGTPVMVNRVGGVPEYVSPECNFLMSNDRNVDEWVEKLLWLERNREVAEKMRPATRAWAERFDWKTIAEDYKAMYRQVLARG